LRFNKEQKEGLAKVADNLATACIVAMIVGGVVDRKIGWETMLYLTTASGWIIIVGLTLRKGDDNDD